MRILFLILLIFTFFVNTAKGVDPLLAIKLNNSAAVEYCTEPVLVAKDLTIEGTFTITGMKISFSEGYMPGEDELVYTGSIGNIIGTWSSGQGYLLLKGNTSTTKENYQDAIKSVTYKNVKPIPTHGTRKISITLDDADYLDETKHFYQFISKPGIKWTVARDEAAATLYHGLLRGYLATILTKGESDFINLKTQGEGWIGASDAKVEEEWRWVTGPEGLMGGGDGLLFWKGSGIKAKLNNPPGVYGPVTDPQGNPYYHNWNKWDDLSGNECTYEPNNWTSVNNVVTCGTSNVPGEDYAHITKNLKWNDYANDNQSTSGYLIEFGGMPGDPDVNLFASLELQVNTMTFYKSGIQSPICEGKSLALNQADPTNATYTWTPAESLSSSTSANPVASPVISATYTVTGKRGTCPAVTATYIVQVNPKPVSGLNPVENICTGQTKALDPGLNPGYTYFWNNGSIAQSITINTAAVYSVTVTTDKSCSEEFKTEVVVHKYPTIDLSNLQKLICGDTKATTVNITSNTTDYSFVSVDNKASVSGLNVNVPIEGVYPMKFTANHQYCPIHEDFNLSFYKNPKGTLTVNGQAEGQKCFGYNLDAVFNPAGDLTGANYEWEFGGAAIASGIGMNTQVVPLGISLAKRDLKLTVTKDGCPASFTEPGILVVPNLSLTVNTGGLVCAPLDVVFTATSEGAIKYDWVFGDSDHVIPGLTPDQKHTYQNAGFYDVHLKVTTGDDCSNEVKIPKMVHVAPIPDVAFSLSPDICLDPGENQLSYAGLIGTGKDTYIWNLDNFDASEIIADPLLKRGPLKFDLKTKPTATIGLKVTSEFGCESLPGSILVRRKPDFSIQSDLLAGCVPFEPTLSGIIHGGGDIVNFTWDFGDGTTDSGSPTLHTYSAPGRSLNVTLNGISSVTGCMNLETGTDLLKTYAKPSAEFGMDNKIVYNDKPDVKFTDRSIGASDWSWDFGDGSRSAEQSPTYHFMKMGPQKVSLLVTNTDGCTDEVSDTVLVAFDRLFPPNGFSPNAPNSIDQVFLLNSEGIAPEGYHFTVLSRWNDVIFEVENEIKGWDGRIGNGTFAPAGAYVWILNFTDFLGRKHRQTGTVTLVY